MAAVSSEDSNDYHPERLAVKVTYAADILKNSVNNAEELQRLEKKISRYVQQANLILTWRRSTGVLKMAGSAAKTVGNVMVLAAPFHPKLGLALKVGHKLWKFGAGLKILNAVGAMLKDLWQTGCRNALIDFTHCTAQLTRNLGVFSEVIRDLQGLAQTANNNNTIELPNEIVNLVRQFIPPHQIGYVTHVINIAFGSRHYSPLFDFINMSCDPANESNVAQLMREIESFHFSDFVEQSDSKPLVAIGSFLHISRELLDFLDGLQRVTDHDCRFLQECLTKFTQESVTIMKVVGVLTNLDQIRRQQSLDPPNQSAVPESLYGTRDQSRDVVHRQQSITNSSSESTVAESHPGTATDKITELNIDDELVIAAGPVLNITVDRCSTFAPADVLDGNDDSVILFHEPGTVQSDISEIIDHTKIDSDDEDDHTDPMKGNRWDGATENIGTSDQSAIIQNSRLLFSRTVSSFSLAVNKGSNLVTSAVSGVWNYRRVSATEGNNQFEAEQSSLNRL